MILDDFKTALDRLRQYWLEKRVRLEEVHQLDDYHHSSSGDGRRPLRRDYGIEAAMSREEDPKHDVLPRVVTTEDTGRRHMRAASLPSAARYDHHNEIRPAMMR